jgi:hypothetical protein
MDQRVSPHPMSRIHAFADEPLDHEAAAEMEEVDEASRHHANADADEFLPPEPEEIAAPDYPQYPPEILYVRRRPDVEPAEGRANSSASTQECCGCRVPMLTRCQPVPMWLKIVFIVAIVWMVVFVAPEFLGWQVRPPACCVCLVHLVICCS